SLPQSSRNDPTLYYLALSNELITPKILACTADAERSKAAEFSGLSRTNISYFIGLDAHSTNFQDILSGDRNITGGDVNQSILTFRTNTNQAGWDKSIHNRLGNVGLADGSAQQLTAQGLNKQLQAMSNENVRFLIP
ncbi:MAG TPA: hypothetical protein VMZ27_12035, partial [Candidatus Saccharimonadales bacterium]|nr:hypothetical protein [Candidatus Saccharimonadales bacterium]